MELRHLRYFVSVAQEQSFTKAAEKLFTAQPSLSQQIRDLEEEVGVSLFDRSTRKIKLTEEGEAFLEHALNSLESAKLAIATARQVAQRKNNQLHIGFLNVAEIKLMPNIIAQLKQYFPELKIHLHSLTCFEQIQRLKNAELDLTFTRYHLEHPDFENIHLLSEQIYLVGSSNIVSPQQQVKKQDLQHYPLIMSEQNASPIFYDKMDQLFHFDQHQQMIWVTNAFQHLNLINMGMGLSFVPEYLLKFLHPNVHIIKLEQDLPKLGLYATFSKTSKNQSLKMITTVLSAHRV